MSQVNTNQVYTTSTQPVNYNTTTSTYVAPGATTYTSTSPQYYTSGQQQTYTTTTTAAPQYSTAQAYTSNAVVGQTAAYSSTLQAGSGVRRAVAEEIPVESRIEYIPFEKKYVEYEQVEKVYQVPVETEVVEYEEVVRNERIPIERTITDYYAVETQVEYIRREIEETVMVEEPVEKVSERIQYIPVETQIVHYPERDNYVAAPTKTRTEYVGVVEGGSGVRQSAVQGGTYVSGGSGVNTYQTSYQTQAVAPAATYTTTTLQQPATYTTTTAAHPITSSYTATGGQHVTSSSYATNNAYQSYQPGATYTTTTGGYVTGGSGVRAASGYVTGGSGVRGSGVKQTYETTYHA